MKTVSVEAILKNEPCKRAVAQARAWLPADATEVSLADIAGSPLVTPAAMRASEEIGHDG